jgi:hypothetical protein
MLEFKTNKNLILKGWMMKRPNLKKTKNGKYRIPKWPNLRTILKPMTNITRKRLNDKKAKYKKDLMPKWSNLIKILKSIYGNKNGKAKFKKDQTAKKPNKKSYT